MTPRQLKRLEDLLRVANDKSTTTNERELATTEALRIVETVRSKNQLGDWVLITVMRYHECCTCGEKIKPTEKVWVAPSTENTARFQHDKCYNNLVSSTSTTTT